MVTVQESSTEVDDGAFIEDNYTRAGDGLITTIEVVKRFEGYSTDVVVTVSEPCSAGTWRYDEGVLATWDEDSCWLVKLAKERGVGLENLDDLEDEEVYIERNDEDECWSMHAEHPREMFDESEIEGSITLENKKTLESRDEVTEDEDIESDCMKYETSGDYFVCGITEMEEIERDGACNIIEVAVDTPYDEGSWQFKKPYAWNEDNTLVQLAESRNYGHGNFTSLVGDEVLVKRENNEWSLNTENPRKKRTMHAESVGRNDELLNPEKTVALTVTMILTVILILFLLISVA